MSDELPFLRRLRALATGGGRLDADELISDLRQLIIEVDWLRSERERLHTALEATQDSAAYQIGNTLILAATEIVNAKALPRADERRPWLNER